MLTGVPAAAALDRHCYEVVHGHDDAGRTICGPGCPAAAALRAGRLTASSSLRYEPDDATPLHLRCELSALPPTPGCALGRLASADEAGAPGVHWPRSRTGAVASDIVRDLAALALVATSLSGMDAAQELERALDLLREATGSDSAELFLAEPGGHDMLLTGYRGPFRASFAQMVRFAPGNGFPGLVMADRQPVATNRLQHDERYLRSRVKARGYQAYLCVPLATGDGVIGAVCLGSRDAGFPVEGAQRLLSWASAPIATALQLGLLRSRRLVAAPTVATDGAPAERLDLLLDHVLRRAVEVADADGGTLVLFDPGSGAPTSRAVTGSGARRPCPVLDGLPPGCDCPALRGEHGVALFGSPRGWPAACRQAGRCAAMTSCFPLWLEGGAIGLIQLNHSQAVPDPPTRRFRALLEVTSEAAPLVKLARDQAEAQRALDAGIQRWLQAGRPVPGEQRHLTPDAGVEPYLRIRCFGDFELHREGRLIPPHLFKRRKALTLLKILALHAGRRVSSESLIEWLWPGCAPEAGANRLHVVVHALRAMLEPDGVSGDRHVIRTSDDQYLLDPGVPCWLDLDEFDHAIRAGQQAEALGDRARAMTAYDAAARLYRGELFEDEPFAEWCWLDREHLRELHLDALQRLAGLAQAAGDLHRAVEVYRRALHIDPLREATQLRFIECLWLTGRRDEALAQYERLRVLLRQELDITPLAETEALIQRIRA